MAFRTNKTPVLQTKSASGSVATFNTALAMPLSSCNIAVNAWQEGSGDPSPDNVRPIHGFSEVNATRAGKNLLNGLSGSGATVDITYDNITGEYTLNGTASGNYLYVVDLPYELPIGTFCVSSVSDVSDIIIRLQTSDGVTVKTFNLDSVNPKLNFTTDRHISRYVIRLNGETTYNNYKFKLQLEAGSTATAYEPYVTPTIYTIQLGQEVYGAEVDVVNGVAHVTHGIIIFNGTETWNIYGSSVGYYVYLQAMKQGRYNDGLSDKFKLINNNNQLGILLGYDNKIAYFCQINQNISEVTDLATWKTWLSNNNVELVYPLAEPFDIQLTPTQIETLIGNNAIFCDTGDIDLTYKDLDIAKRGNFREVFRLPS